jgi:hypothetical protein
MMVARAWSPGSDMAGVGTAMITSRAVPALLPVHHRRVATSPAITKRLCRPPGAPDACRVGPRLAG